MARLLGWLSDGHGRGRGPDHGHGHGYGLRCECSHLLWTYSVPVIVSLRCVLLDGLAVDGETLRPAVTQSQPDVTVTVTVTVYLF
jgi:hypothetical protein